MAVCEDRSIVPTVTLGKYFSDEDNARGFLEAIRWPDGPVCHPIKS
jgi:hypothetical protein